MIDLVFMNEEEVEKSILNSDLEIKANQVNSSTTFPIKNIQKTNIIEIEPLKVKKR